MDILTGGRRRKLIVDKSFQLRTAFASVFYVVAVGTCLSVPFIYLIRSTNYLLASHGRELAQLVRDQQKITVVAASLYLVGLLVASIFFSLWRSHRVAGPVVNFKRNLEMLAQGNFSARVRLREGDELRDLAEAFNAAAERLQEREKNLADRTRHCLEKAKAAIGRCHDPAEQRRIIHDMETELASILSFPATPKTPLKEEIFSVSDQL